MSALREPALGVVRPLAHIGPLPSRDQLAADWLALEATAEGTPFTSWAWVSTWLQHLPARVQPLLFIARDAQGLLALGLLVARRPSGLRRLLPGHDLHLQETGCAELDELTLEYAGLLARRGAEDAAWAAFLRCLAGQRGWSRLLLSDTTETARIHRHLPPALVCLSRRSRPSYRIDLDALRTAGDGYTAQLSKRMRRELARVEGLYRPLGPLRLDVAADAATARQWLSALERLHTGYWNARGEGGAFASAFFRDFHQGLVGAHNGRLVRLTRIRAGDHDVGYTYHLYWRRHWYFYNAGLDYSLLGNHQDRPGFLAQKLLVEHVLEQGEAGYEFMAGDQLYKRRLATGQRQLHDLELRRRGPLLWSEQCLRRLLGRPPLGAGG